MTSIDPNYQHFFDHSADLLCIAGFDGYFKRINPAVVKTLGYTEEELFSRPINEFVHQEDQIHTSLVRDELHKINPLYNFENRYLTKEGEIVWLSWTSMPVEDQQVVFAIAKNVTHKKKLEADRNTLLAQLTQVNEELLRFSYMTSHDLRAPVNNLISAFDLMDVDKIADQETRELIDIIEMSCKNLKTTLNTYVDNLVEGQKQFSKIEKVSLGSVLDSVKNSIPNLIQFSNARIESDFTEVEMLDYNPALLESILLNLLTNAIKYAKIGVHPHIRIQSKKLGGQVMLEFRDNGIGMDLEEVGDRIFGLQEKFSDSEDSKGVGLYLVHHHIKKMGGTIDVSSEPGMGTLFTIVF